VLEKIRNLQFDLNDINYALNEISGIKFLKVSQNVLFDILICFETPDTYRVTKNTGQTHQSFTIVICVLNVQRLS